MIGSKQGRNLADREFIIGVRKQGKRFSFAVSEVVNRETVYLSRAYDLATLFPSSSRTNGRQGKLCEKAMIGNHYRESTFFCKCHRLLWHFFLFLKTPERLPCEILYFNFAFYEISFFAFSWENLLKTELS